MSAVASFAPRGAAPMPTPPVPTQAVPMPTVPTQAVPMPPVPAQAVPMPTVPMPPVPAHAVPMPHATTPAADSLRVRDAGIRFGELTVFEHLDFAVGEGEFVSLLGPSGCGKSTLLKAMAGLAPLSSGAIDVCSGRPGERRMALVFQKPLLLPWRTLLENVLLPAEIGLGGNAVGAADRARARRLIELVRLGGFADAYPHQLSGGMQQRAALARALMSDAEILLMDEPFGALDELTRTTLNEELLQIWRSSATRLKTVVMVTHSIAEAVALSDRVLVFSSRPARIIDTVSIAPEQPRQPDDPEVARIIKRLRASIRAVL